MSAPPHLGTGATPEGTEPSNGPTAGLLLVLTFLIAFQPAGTDLYLPSLPAIATEFGTQAVGVQWTLTVFLVAFSLAQLAVGPVSDRYGRRPVVLGGQFIFCLASLVGYCAPSLSWLIAARTAQAIGASCTVVCARAMTRDLFNPATGARVTARMLSWMVVVPIVGPAVGGWTQQHWGWRTNFLLLALYALVATVCTLRLSTETLPHQQRLAIRLDTFWPSCREVLSSPTFRAWLALASWSYLGVFAYLSNSAFALMKVLGLNPAQFGLSFSFTSLGYLVGVRWVRRRILSRGLRDAPAIGALLAPASGLLMAVLAALDVQHPAAILLPVFGYLIAHGINQPCATNGALGPFSHCAGTAAALLGTLMAIGAAPIGWAIAESQDGTTRPLCFAIGVCGVGVALSWQYLVRRLPESNG